MKYTEKITAKSITIANRQIVPVLERTAWLTPHGGWYMTQVCSLRIKENQTVYDYPLILSSPDPNHKPDNQSGTKDSNIP